MKVVEDTKYSGFMNPTVVTRFSLKYVLFCITLALLFLVLRQP